MQAEGKGYAADRWQATPRRTDLRAGVKAWVRDHRQGCALALRVGATSLLAFALAAFTLRAEAAAQTAPSPINLAATNLPSVGAFARLRPEVTVHGPVVTLGDLVSGAGAAASTPVFMAPEPGLVGHLDVHLVRAAALDAGLSGVDAAGLDRIAVHRYGTMASAADIETLLRGELAGRLGAPAGESLDIAFTDAPRDMTLAGEAVPHFTSLDVFGDRFEGLVRLGGQVQPVRGRVAVKVPALVLTRALGRGEVLDMDDLTFAEVLRPQHGETVPAYEEAIGFAVTRALKAGDTLMAGDLMRPIVMTRGEPVTLVHRTGRMVLTARGNALKDGRIGDVIDVLNTQSRRIVQARVLNEGEAEALGGAPKPARVSMR